MNFQGCPGSRMMDMRKPAAADAFARRALESATRKVPVKEVIVGLDGAIRQSEWLAL